MNIYDTNGGSIPTYKEGEFPVEYFDGNETDFVLFVKAQGDKAELAGIDGHFRWVLTREDGSRYILRPAEAKPQ